MLVSFVFGVLSAPLPTNKQLARALPGTVVFFDKFCPDLRGGCSGSGSGFGSGFGSSVGCPDARKSTPEGGGSVDDPPLPGPPVSSSTMMAAACRWCSKELGNAQVIALSEDESDCRVGDDERSGNGETFSLERDAGQAGAEEGGAGSGGGGGTPLRVLNLRGFLHNFVGGEAGEELARRGDLLRGVHLSNKVERVVGRSCFW